MIYIIFENPQESRGQNKKSILTKIISLFIPRANPDFDNLIEQTSFWLLEFDDEESIPNREIGLTMDGEVLLKMPHKNNYGYWLDNHLTYSDFKNSFTVNNISKEFFEEKWNKMN